MLHVCYARGGGAGGLGVVQDRRRIREHTEGVLNDYIHSKMRSRRNMNPERGDRVATGGVACVVRAGWFDSYRLGAHLWRQPAGVGDPRVIGREVRQDETRRELEGKTKGIDQGRKHVKNAWQAWAFGTSRGRCCQILSYSASIFSTLNGWVFNVQRSATPQRTTYATQHCIDPRHLNGQTHHRSPRRR